MEPTEYEISSIEQYRIRAVPSHPESNICIQYVRQEVDNAIKNGTKDIDSIWKFSIKQNGHHIDIAIMIYASPINTWIRYLTSPCSDGRSAIVIGIQDLCHIGKEMQNIVIQDVFENLFEWFIRPELNDNQRIIYVQMFGTLMYCLFYDTTGKQPSTLFIDISKEVIYRMTKLKMFDIEDGVRVLNLYNKTKRHQFANLLFWMFTQNDECVKKIKEYTKKEIDGSSLEQEISDAIDKWQNDRLNDR